MKIGPANIDNLDSSQDTLGYDDVEVLRVKDIQGHASSQYHRGQKRRGPTGPGQNDQLVRVNKDVGAVKAVGAFEEDKYYTPEYTVKRLQQEGSGDGSMASGSQYSRGSVQFLYANPGYGRHASEATDHRGRLPQYQN